MPTSNFYLKEPNKNKDTLIFLKFRFQVGKDENNKKVDVLKLYTQLKINPKFWNKNSQQVRRTYPNYKDLNEYLSNFKNKIQSIYLECIRDELITSKDYLRKKIDEKLNPKTDKYDNLICLIDFIIEKSQKNNEKKKTTIQKYITTKNHILNFLELSHKTDIELKKIDYDFFDDFRGYFYNKLKSNENTVAKNIKVLKFFLNVAKKRNIKLNENLELSNINSAEFETDKIFLTEEEVNRLYQLDLSFNKTFEKIRDLFFVGCRTALRYSDWGLKPENFKDNYIQVRTKKNNKNVAIPISKEVREIKEKYSGHLPKQISLAKTNLYLKEICKLAKIDEDVQITKKVAGDIIKDTQPKYKFVSTHTARRSGATNMFINKIPPSKIMKITGHRTEREFLKYIRIDELQNAKLIKDNQFFE